MSLLDRIRQAVRVNARYVTDANGNEPGDEGYENTLASPFDEELSMLIGAAERDLLRVGIREYLVHPTKGEIGADIEQCITLYVKCHFGFDNAEAPRFGESYRMAVCDLMHSPANIADTTVEDPEPEPEPEPPEGEDPEITDPEEGEDPEPIEGGDDDSVE